MSKKCGTLCCQYVFSKQQCSSVCVDWFILLLFAILYFDGCLISSSGVWLFVKWACLYILLLNLQGTWLSHSEFVNKLWKVETCLLWRELSRNRVIRNLYSQNLETTTWIQWAVKTYKNIINNLFIYIKCQFFNYVASSYSYNLFLYYFL